jgi:predicted metal-dependent hydrolase
MSTHPPIVPRQGPDFGLCGELPRFWFGGDPFKTRFFDANSLLTPVGERYFINCVRDYREQVRDAEQAEELRRFVYQEGQHSLVHGRFNQLLREQGIDTAAIENRAQRWFERYRRWLPARLNLALTAAYEHFTTINALAYAPGIALVEPAEPRVLAMFLWHAVEEVEHRAVAYELARSQAGVGWVTRIVALLYLQTAYMLQLLLTVNHMLRVDGYGFGRRLRLWAGGLRWMYGRGGFYQPLLREYLAWYRPGYHPAAIPLPEPHRRWIEAYAGDGDALAAAAAFMARRP